MRHRPDQAVRLAETNRFGEFTFYAEPATRAALYRYVMQAAEDAELVDEKMHAELMLFANRLRSDLQHHDIFVD